MEKIDEAAWASPEEMQMKQKWAKEGIKTVINSPGNARIGGAGANNQVLVTRTL
jgi:hypothetical protein